MKMFREYETVVAAEIAAKIIKTEIDGYVYLLGKTVFVDFDKKSKNGILRDFKEQTFFTVVKDVFA